MLTAPSSRTLLAVSLAVVGALLAADLATGDRVSLVPAYALAPLLAALRCRPRQVISVGAAALLAAVVAAAVIERPSAGQQAVRLVTVAGAAALAAWAAQLRRRSEQSARREAFLGRTGDLLSEAAGDVEETLARVARAAVPAVADWCAIDLREGDAVQRVAVAHVDPAKQRLAEELQRRWPARLDDADGGGAVLRTGEAILHSDIPDVSQWPLGTRDPEHLATLEALGMRSAMIVPLTVRGRITGAITLIAAGSGRRYGPADLSFARDLARRCALAIDNGRLLARERAAQAELAASFALVDSLFESAPIGLAHYDRDLRYVRVNSRLAEINGTPAGLHPGRRARDVLPDVADQVEASLRAVLATGEPVVLEEMGGDFGTPPRRREFHVSYYPVRRGGEILGVGAVVFEITDRRGMERALRSQTDRYETLLLALSEVGEGMMVLERDHLVYANAAFEQLSGYGLDELRALDSVWALVPDWHRAEVRRRARLRAEEGLVDPHYELVMEHRTGRLIDLEAAAVPLWVDEREQLVVVVRDITARKRAEAEREHAHALERQAREAAETAERRMALLAAASELFDETLDEQQTLERIARLTVAEIADTCVVVLAGRDDATGPDAREAIAVARDPRREALMTALAPHLPPELSPEATIARIAQRDRAELVRHFGRWLESTAEAPERIEQIRAIGVSAVALVPLRARDRTFGALACGFAEAPAPDHEREVLSLLEDLARRAALAMDNARLYAERTHVARTLQRSLLPPALPEIPGVELAARYRPAGEGTEVGGDFFDGFATARDHYALVIGDVCGKGAEAAAVTALARYTMRAAVVHSDSPARVLAELNEAILREDLDQRFCTVLFAALEPLVRGGWTARLASGGHPLPLLLRADGRVEQPGRTGTLLGIVADPALEEDTAELRAGDALVLFTDGVTEASPLDGAFGAEALEVLLASLAGRSAGEIADAIEATVLDVQRGRPRDDIAVVVLRVASGT